MATINVHTHGKPLAAEAVLFAPRADDGFVSLSVRVDGNDVSFFLHNEEQAQAILKAAFAAVAGVRKLATLKANGLTFAA